MYNSWQIINPNQVMQGSEAGFAGKSPQSGLIWKMCQDILNAVSAHCRSPIAPYLWHMMPKVCL
jgi:hypothetical protein